MPGWYVNGQHRLGVARSRGDVRMSARLCREAIDLLRSTGLGIPVTRLLNLKRYVTRGTLSLSSAYRLCDGCVAPRSSGRVNQEDSFNQNELGWSWIRDILIRWVLGLLPAHKNLSSCLNLRPHQSCATEKQPPDYVLLRGPRAQCRTRGQIILAGAGPGHPDLLTKATRHAINSADLILSDKLVPEPVLQFIPGGTKVFTAKKFPGNAEKAQEELLSLALAALSDGHRVLRLKQGDPYLYGRGAEEFAFFRGNGYVPVVLPGITSALSAPLFANIPATHRGTADQFLICTGTTQSGMTPEPPSYVHTRTVVFLMALCRLSSLVLSLTKSAESQNSAERSISNCRKPWPLDTPCAIVEKASCPGQRVIRSTLKHVCDAAREAGSRPPGLLVVGASCVALHVSAEKRWVIEEGINGLTFSHSES